MSAIGKRLQIFIVLLIGLFVTGRTTLAQNAVWSGHYGGYYNEGGYASAPTSDGGYFAVGSTYSFGSGDHDIYVLRLDSLGDTLWSRTFGGALADFGRDILVTPDSGCIVVGSTVSWSAGKEDLFILGISSTGNLQWSKTYGGLNSDEAWSVRRTGDGNLIVCGTTSSSGAGYGDLWLLKLTTTGDSIWARTFGGPGGESGMSVKETYDGYIAVGATGSFGEGYSSIYAVKTNFAGDSVWAKTFGGPKADFGYAVEVSNYGDYIIAGATGSYGQGYYDAYVLAVSPQGDVLWEKTYGGVKDDRAYSICTTPNGDFIIGGTTESSGQGAVDMYVLRLNPIGDLIWSRSLGGALSDYCRGVSMDINGNFILSGYSYSYATGGSDLYLLSLSGDAPTAVEELPGDNLPIGFLLEQNYPNPFNGITHIQFSLPYRAAVTLIVYNILGQEVRQWDETTHGAGLFQLDWDGTDERGNDVTSGVYLYSLIAADLNITKKMVLLK
jgi:hypothetical protein